jgi:hypothetical protein
VMPSTARPGRAFSGGEVREITAMEARAMMVCRMPARTVVDRTGGRMMIILRRGDDTAANRGHCQGHAKSDWFQPQHLNSSI